MNEANELCSQNVKNKFLNWRTAPRITWAACTRSPNNMAGPGLYTTLGKNEDLLLLFCCLPPFAKMSLQLLWAWRELENAKAIYVRALDHIYNNPSHIRFWHVIFKTLVVILCPPPSEQIICFLCSVQFYVYWWSVIIAVMKMPSFQRVRDSLLLPDVNCGCCSKALHRILTKG